MKYFGTDGIRGRMGEEPITPTTVMKLGWALGNVLGSNGDSRGKIIIGKDTRVSGYLLESAMEAGLISAGVDVSLLGPMPTPGIAYLARTARAQAGVVISASHNPYYDNGIKFFSPAGEKLPDETEQAIEAMMQQPFKTVDSRDLGKARRYLDAAGRYIEYCKATISNQVSLEGLKIILDCANGASYHIAPSVLTELGARLHVIGDKPDGFNINDGYGATDTATLQSEVVKQGADLGIALDGDGDRLIMVDHRGEIVNGDKLILIMALARSRRGELQGGVVGTVMSNLGMEQALRANKIDFIRAAVGDRYVLELMRKNGWDLGGEASGHIICLDKSTTGDGIVAALEVLQVMHDSGKPLADLAGEMETCPQMMINVTISRDFKMKNNALINDAVRAVEAELGERGRVVLRPSGTEPLIRVMIEGIDASQVKSNCESLAEIVRQEAGNSH
ncbi:MAG: phosphoglucosamine mutase [Pseudomonadota bacterium]|nr:phosphoglucosamine mutase [Pseudomonadota bacterium]